MPSSSNPPMPQQPDPAANASAPSDIVIGLVAANWPKVHVGKADIALRDEPDGERGVVHACVELGELLPVDVDVELIHQHGPMPTSVADRTLARMWSEHSYQNDSYDFEATVPAAELREAGHLAIRVTPASRLALSSLLAPVTAPVTVPGAP